MFKIGDRVRIIKHTDSLIFSSSCGMGISLYPDDVGTEGTIIMCDNRYSDMVYGIHFDNTILDGHSLDGKCPYGHGYNLTEEFIELIQDTEFDLDELYSKFY